MLKVYHSHTIRVTYEILLFKFATYGINSAHSNLKKNRFKTLNSGRFHLTKIFIFNFSD